MSINPVLNKKPIVLNFSYIVQELTVGDIPYEDQCFDTIVVTLVFCSVKNVRKVLSELRRELKDDGQLIFIEHVLPDHNPLRGLFNTLTPVWKRMASGCHLLEIF